ncbi:ArsR family transcriptional regulator [Candidatus Woesearchaeota archaeon]|nr:ArsR family transcriptional regulator [Candidatus Woesearchaeota archaeon]
MHQEILLRNINKPKEADVHKDIDWLCESLGFNAGRDIEKTSSRVVHSILKDIVGGGFTSADDIARDLEIAAQRVNYHVRSLASSGFVFREKRQIFLREGSVKSSIEEMRKDANRIFDKLSVIGEQIDVCLGLKNR